MALPGLVDWFLVESGRIISDLRNRGVLPPGTVIDQRYEIQSVLGEGGMGCVYQCRELGLERLVALKVLHRSLCEDSENRVRFEREGQAVSALRHPNILSLYRFGVWSGVLYMAMEYLEGESLQEILAREGALDWRRALNIALQACDGMQHAHDAGVVHRDLKPGNVLVLKVPTSDFVKIVDFGLARIKESDSIDQRLTQTGQLIGSAYYMSPEQCLGLTADQRSDIYALGCVLYECIAGEAPLLSDNPVGLLHRHVHDLPVSLKERLSSQAVPEEIDRVLFKAMSKKPEDRYQSMREFACDLKAVQAGSPAEVTAPGLPIRRRVGRIPRRVLFLVVPMALAVFFSSEAVTLPITWWIDFRRDDSALSFGRRCASWLESIHRLDQAEAVLSVCSQNAIRRKEPALESAAVLAAQAGLLLRRSELAEARRSADIALRMLDAATKGSRALLPGELDVARQVAQAALGCQCDGQAELAHLSVLSIRYKRLGSAGAAIDYARALLAAHTARYGRYDIRVALCLCRLGHMLAAAGSAAEATDCLARASSLKSRLARNDLYAMFLLELAALNVLLRHFQEAACLQEEGWECFAELGPEARKLAGYPGQLLLARAYGTVGRMDDCTRAYQKAASYISTVEGQRTPTTPLQGAADLVDQLMRLDRYGEAASYLECLARDPWLIKGDDFHALFWLARAARRLGREEESERLLFEISQRCREPALKRNADRLLSQIESGRRKTKQRRRVDKKSGRSSAVG